MSDSIVEAENLALGYGSRIAVRRASLDIPPGLTLLIGPNGSGKSTLLRAIAGLLKPLRGRMRVLGLDPYYDISLVVEQVLYIPEGDPYPETIPVEKIIETLSSTYGRKRVKRYLDLLGLEKYMALRVGELSYGTRRRLLLLEGLAAERKLLLLDEPYRGLDKKSRSRVSGALAELAKEGKTSTIIASHVMPRLPITHVVVMEDGETTYSGPPSRERVICTVIEC